MNKLNEHKFCLNNEEALQFIELLKSYDKDLYWNKGRNIHWRTINFVPNDRDELAGPVPGATVQVWSREFIAESLCLLSHKHNIQVVMMFS